MIDNLKNIVEKFCFEGKFIEANPYGFGHINDTLVTYFKLADARTRRYILQRINNKVFKDPEKLMENIAGVTGHLHKKIMEKGGNPNREALTIIPAKDGKYFYKSGDGSYWRGYIFIEDAHTYQVVENLNHFYNAGIAFGKFQGLLSDYAADTLHETIVNFHNTPKRFEAFVEAVERDGMNRAKDAGAEIEFILSRAKETSIITDMLKNKELPLRVTHNDTKFNNVMVDDITGAGICVIDLDTVMPGSSLYDFGDSIRSGANPADEDERNLSKVWMELDLYEQFTRGFVETAGGFLTKKELEMLPWGAKLMTFECGIRFLTDHLNGDTYFKIHRENHNLDRARTQFKMVADMEAKFEQMGRIIEKYK
jgi:hypothetical protein